MSTANDSGAQSYMPEPLSLRSVYGRKLAKQFSQLELYNKERSCYIVFFLPSLTVMTTKYTDILNTAKQGNWDEAHQLIQDQSDSIAYLIHGYLHRIEGDQGNAQYWYNRAQTRMPDNTLDEEWKRLYQLCNSH